jgi:hypothetical protein
VLTDKLKAFVAFCAALKAGEGVTLPKLPALTARGKGMNMATRSARTIPSVDALGGGISGRARQVQTIITGLVIVIVASLAVIVVDQFDQSLGDPSSSALSSSQNNILEGFSDMADLIGPLLLVLIAAVIIGVIQRLRG